MHIRVVVYDWTIGCLWESLCGNEPRKKENIHAEGKDSGHCKQPGAACQRVRSASSEYA
jgi:hypothetical protein